MSADFVNGCFEMAASGFLINNCLLLRRQKQVRGVSILSTAFFFAWGLWNIFYYPHLDQYFSFVGGMLVVTANALWVSLMLRYRKN